MDTIRDNPTQFADDGAVPDAAGAEAPTGQVSRRTNIHDEGSDANDTADGLTEAEEAVRHAAEDIPTGQRPEGKIDSVPVFDRASLPPKV